MMLLEVVLKSSSVPVGNSIVLTGLSGSGKTSLFYLLSKGDTPATVSSTAIQRSTIETADIKKGITLVDIPGHENFKQDTIREIINSKGVIFLLDTKSRNNVYKSALYLYDIFINKQIQSKGIDMMIVYNNMDDRNSMNIGDIRVEIEKEIDRIRLSRRAYDSNDTSTVDYIKDGVESFSLDSVRGIRISYSNVNIHTSSVEDIKTFINSIKI